MACFGEYRGGFVEVAERTQPSFAISLFGFGKQVMQ